MSTKRFRFQQLFRGLRNETAAMALANRDSIVKDFEKDEKQHHEKP